MTFWGFRQVCFYLRFNIFLPQKNENYHSTVCFCSKLLAVFLLVFAWRFLSGMFVGSFWFRPLKILWSQPKYKQIRSPGLAEDWLLPSLKSVVRCLQTGPSSTPLRKGRKRAGGIIIRQDLKGSTKKISESNKQETLQHESNTTTSKKIIRGHHFSVFAFQKT